MVAQLINVNAHQIQQGDIVHMYGGRFQVQEPLSESSGHRPEGYWPQAGVGPSDCVWAPMICLEGEVPGYFRPGSEFSLQGNQHAMFRIEPRA